MKFTDYLIVITVLLIACGIIAFVISVPVVGVREATIHWNNGICENCGGNYKFAGADHGSYYYSCEKCNHTIKTYSLME